MNEITSFRHLKYKICGLTRRSLNADLTQQNKRSCQPGRKTQNSQETKTRAKQTGANTTGGATEETGGYQETARRGRSCGEIALLGGLTQRDHHANQDIHNASWRQYAPSTRLERINPMVSRHVTRLGGVQNDSHSFFWENAGEAIRPGEQKLPLAITVYSCRQVLFQTRIERALHIAPIPKAGVHRLARYSPR